MTSPSSNPSLSILFRVGTAFIEIAERAGGMAKLSWHIALRSGPRSVDRHELFRNLYRMGVSSVGVVSATAIFVGAVMVIQAAPMVMRFNAKDLIGWGSAFATLREVGPLLIALVFNGRVGANNTAEIASMVVTEQVDALRALAIDPIRHLVVPRVIAMVCTILILTVIGDAVAMLGSLITAYVLVDVDPRTFHRSVVTLLTPMDFLQGLAKSVIFGAMIGLSSCYFGLSVKGGAPGVGRAVTASVVASASGIFALDYLATLLLR